MFLPCFTASSTLTGVMLPVPCWMVKRSKISFVEINDECSCKSCFLLLSTVTWLNRGLTILYKKIFVVGHGFGDYVLYCWLCTKSLEANNLRNQKSINFRTFNCLVCRFLETLCTASLKILGLQKYGDQILYVLLFYS